MLKLITPNELYVKYILIIAPNTLIKRCNIKTVNDVTLFKNSATLLFQNAPTFVMW